MKIKKGDKIIVIAGKDKGQKGTVERVYPKQNKVLIPKINIYKRHVKKNQQLPQGGVVELPRPLNIAKVAIICPKCTKIARIGYLVTDKKKVRICRKCKSPLDK